MKVTDKRSKLGRYIPTFVFLIFMYGIGIWFLLSPKSDYSSSEKRYLQQFPEVSVESITDGEFTSEFETFFADQFPKRNFWVGFNSYYNTAIGNNGSNGVYLCDNGYLINKPVSTDNRLEKNINAVVNFKNSIDAPVSVMLVPSTGYISDDVLPKIHNKYNDDEYFKNISSTLSNNGIGFVDLRESFKEAYKNGTRLYYKTDHHWTTQGAYLGYEQYCNSLGIEPAPKDMFEVKSYDGFYGTTYSTGGYWFTEPDRIEVWNNKRNTDGSIKLTITEGKTTDEYTSMYFYNHLKEDDKYPVFIDGNHAYTEITNSNAKGGTLLMIKDSFSHCIAPFLAENYSKIILIDTRYYKNSVSDIVKQENPEQVLVMYGIDNLATDTDIVWLK